MSDLGIKAKTEECNLCKQSLQVFEIDNKRLVFDSLGVHYCLQVPDGAELLVLED